MLIGILLLCLLACTAQAEPQRIVSTSPSITEALFALGLGDHVVGVSNYCEYPAQVKDLPKVGTYLRPDPELIARLNPDLVIIHKLPNELTNRLSALHIPYAEVDRGGLEDVFTEIQEIGKATGATAQAEGLIGRLRARLEEIRAQARNGKTVSVIFVIGREPGTLSNLVVVGRDAFLNALIAVAGGNNLIARESDQPYPHIGLETVLRLNPDVIIDMGDMGGTLDERKRKAEESRTLWQSVANVRAVKNGHVYCLTSTAFLVPGPRVSEAAEILFSILQGKNPQ
jgi:iron complex transport system substrate-binding protein